MRRNLSQVAWTADPTLAMVQASACTGAGGIVESPSWNSTPHMGSPSASAATWAIDVVVPGPMSLLAERTTAVPSASSRACACAGALSAGYAPAAIPIPISQSPSRTARGRGLRRCQPNSRMPVA